MLSGKLILILAPVHLSGCSTLFGSGINPEKFAIGNAVNVGQEMLTCMKPADPWVPGELGGILDKAASLNPLAVLANADPIEKFPLLASVGEVTDFTDTFFSLMPEMYSLLQQDTTETRGKIYKTYLRAYFNQEGFVSRSGLKLKFPGMPNIGLDGKVLTEDLNKNNGLPSSVDFTQVGTDIVRVFLEALRDASLKEGSRLPGVTGSTGVKGGFLTNALATTEWNVDPTKFAKIEIQASQAEGMLATAVGKAARGGSWGALNNEAMAKVAETVAGVEARYAVERFEWCKAKTEKSKQ